MPRPRMNRWIRHQPLVQFYAPQGVPLGRLRGVTLTLDGLEALRLADAEGLEQEQAAELMGISRPTFSRLLAEARGVVARGLGHPHRGRQLRVHQRSSPLRPSAAPLPAGSGRRHDGDCAGSVFFIG
jgi:predicted DNA-binding protein (UPF0251 family)